MSKESSEEPHSAFIGPEEYETIREKLRRMARTWSVGKTNEHAHEYDPSVTQAVDQAKVTSDPGDFSSAAARARLSSDVAASAAIDELSDLAKEALVERDRDRLKDAATTEVKQCVFRCFECKVRRPAEVMESEKYPHMMEMECWGLCGEDTQHTRRKEREFEPVRANLQCSECDYETIVWEDPGGPEDREECPECPTEEAINEFVFGDPEPDIRFEWTGPVDERARDIAESLAEGSVKDDEDRDEAVDDTFGIPLLQSEEIRKRETRDAVMAELVGELRVAQVVLASDQDSQVKW